MQNQNNHFVFPLNLILIDVLPLAVTSFGTMCLDIIDFISFFSCFDRFLNIHAAFETSTSPFDTCFRFQFSQV